MQHFVIEREVLLQHRFQREGVVEFDIFAATAEELISDELDMIEDEEEVLRLVSNLVSKYRDMGFDIDTDDD